MLLYVKRQLTSDNKFFKYISSLTFKLEVLILSLSNIGKKDGRIGGLSCDVDVDEDIDVNVDVDVDVDFEQSEEVFLQIAVTDTISFSNQFIVSSKETRKCTILESIKDYLVKCVIFSNT